MRKPNPREVLAALLDEIMLDVLSMTEAELRQEALEDGEDFEARVAEVRNVIAQAVEKAKRSS